MKAATAVIDRRALRHNLQQIRRLAPQSRLIAVVKANAYGHGLLETAHTLQDADCYGVARIGEALMLRAGGIVKPILLLEGFSVLKICPRWWRIISKPPFTASNSLKRWSRLNWRTRCRYG